MIQQFQIQQILRIKNMSVRLFIPTWATFNRFPSGTPDAGLKVLSAVFGTTFSVGDDNPVWRDLQDLDLGGGPLSRGSSLTDLAEVTQIENDSFLTFSQIQLIVAVGGNAKDMPLWFKIAEADYSQSVPAVLPDSADKTWEDWTEVAHSGPWDGYYYIPTSAGDRYLPDASIVVATGLTVITQPEFIALREQE